MYNWEGMKKINFETARKYFCYSEVEVYLLFDDNTESLAHTERELEEHEAKGNGLVFGVHMEDYNKVIIKEWKGMNFKSWCEIGKDDYTKIVYKKTPYGSFTSEDTVDGSYMSMLQSAIIDNIQFINNEWHIWLI